MGTLASNIDPDEMQNNAAFHLGLHCLLILKHTSGTEIYHESETSICDPLKYKCTIPYLLYQYVWENPSETKALRGS